MSWLKVAFGIIREAAGTELGQEVIDNIRSGRSRSAEPVTTAPDVDALIAEHRQQVNRNLETIVAMLNEQNARLNEALRRQRIWNIALAAGLAVAIVLAIVK
jgi:hypothetical protein